MKNYNKILEAIDKGILLALDDYDDTIISQPKKLGLFDDKSSIDNLKLDLAVDLGLVSGTLWCNYNLGVDPNKLDTFEDWYGDYYAWAETETKRSFSSDNYSFDVHPNLVRTDAYRLQKDTSKYKKYFNEAYKKCKYEYERFELPRIEMDLEDDAAYVHGSQYKDFVKICIPTREQYRELVKNCSEKNVYNYKGVVGLDGKVFTSKINGKCIFFPFSGYGGLEGGRRNQIHAKGYYWTSTLSCDKPICSESFEIEPCKDKEYKIRLQSTAQYNGIAIRPVILNGTDRARFKCEYGRTSKIIYDE